MRRTASSDRLRSLLEEQRYAGASIGLVPTMGALHAGHLSLVELAAQRTDVVVMSIFVNPLQFGPSEDLERYPRSLDRDLELAADAGVDVVFVPTVEDMYPEGRAATVRVARIGENLEGAQRPGHFDGVATVVAKLFNLVSPDVAAFGQKDAQQLAVIKRMVADLDFDIEIVAGPIVREPDGLALSSRNVYLSEVERADALALYRALLAGAESLKAGEGPAVAEKQMLEVLGTAPEVAVDYAVAVDPDTFSDPGAGDVLLAAAGRLGTTRLIDNLVVKASERGTG